MTGQSTNADAVINLMTACCVVRSCRRPAEWVAIQALLGHSTINTTRIYTHVGQERMEQGVARL
jgi:integrase